MDARDHVRRIVDLLSDEAITLDDYRRHHALYKLDRDLQAAHAAYPFLVTLDDHEVENDYAGWQGEFLQADFVAQRTAAYQAYWEHMPLPKSLRPRDGVLPLYGAFDWGALGRLLVMVQRIAVAAQAGDGGAPP